MTEATSVTPAPRKRRGWLRVLAWLVGTVLVLLVVGYFVVTSAGFFKGVILPRVGQAMNAQVTVSSVTLSPFSQLILRDLKVTTTGTEPLVSAAEVRLRYSLMDIIKGNIKVDEVALVSPTVALVENADGSSNLDPILKSRQPKASEKKPEQPSKPSAGKPPQLDLKKFAVTDATLRRVRLNADGTREVMELSHLNVALEDLKNGQTGKLALQADIGMQKTNGLLQAKLGGELALSLAADLKPSSIRGGTRLEVTRAEGALADMAGFVSDVNLELSPTDIKEAALRFRKGDVRLGELRVSGPFDMAKSEGRLSVVLSGIDKKLLNLAGAQSGLDFGSTTIASTNEVEVARGGSLITASGRTDVNNLQVTRTNPITPRLDLRGEYEVVYDLTKQVADVRRLQVALPPTARATNQVQLSGQVDMSQPNAIQGNLKLAADSLDLTSYYDFFMGQKGTPETAPVAGGPKTAGNAPPAPAGAKKEPEAMKLPLRNFTVAASIRRLYLHEVEVADWEVTTKIEGGRVVINPFNLMLNGAPVNSVVDLDLGVPGWKYNLSLSGAAIPLAPLVNSFQPERKGILSGTLTAQTKLGGAGTTDASLQKNFTGQFDLASTNLNLSVDNIQGKTFYTRLLKTVVKAVAAIPDLAKNPAGTATALFQELTGSGASTTASTGSGATDVAKSPINAIVLRGSAGSGRVDLQQALVQSPGFEAEARGAITLAEVLTNSPLQMPVSVSLERSVAQRIRMAGNAPTNATYVKLPQCLTLKGTLGNSKPEVDWVALTAGGLQGVGGKAGQAGAALQAIGNLLPGSKNASGGSGTNQAPVTDVIKGLFGPKKK